jgi:hypothetical protein
MQNNPADAKALLLVEREVERAKKDGLLHG